MDLRWQTRSSEALLRLEPPGRSEAVNMLRPHVGVL
jgi:hypothetical protein